MSDTQWIDGLDLVVEGKGWDDTPGPYDRLPARAEGIVSEFVWQLSRNAAGLGIRFVTDSPTISVRWRLRSGEEVLPLMAAAGFNGVDLYVREPRRWRFLGAGMPAALDNEAVLIDGLDRTERELLLQLPLYNGVESAAIGVEAGAAIRPAAVDERRPLCMYGTSIVQGASASRPGMCHTAMLRRRLDHPVLNLGFAGNGTMERPVADLLAELDVAAYVVDSLPNMQAPGIEDRAPTFLRTITAARPEVPLLVVGATTRLLHPAQRDIKTAAEAALARIVAEVQAEGAERLRWVDAAELLGDDEEGTVDTVHPNDLGFSRMAEALLPTLRAALS